MGIEIVVLRSVFTSRVVRTSSPELKTDPLCSSLSSRYADSLSLEVIEMGVLVRGDQESFQCLERLNNTSSRINKLEVPANKMCHLYKCHAANKSMFRCN